MFLRRHSFQIPLRLFVLLAVLAGMAGLVAAYDGREAGPASADPAYGSVKVNPFSGFIIEGHHVGVGVQMNTCADATTPPSFTAESGTITSITDNQASWTTNQWAGYDIHLTSGPGSVQYRTVTSNTVNTLTVGTAWGGVLESGTADGGSTTTVIDFNSNWLTNEFATGGSNTYTVEFTGPEGAQTRTIVSNTADTLTVTPAYTTHVSTSNATGGTSTTLVDTTKNWTTNQWVNKTVQLTAGFGSLQSHRIISNTSNTLTIDGTWLASAGGSATAGTTNTLVDASRAWTTNEFAGYTVELIGGTGSGQSRVISSNTGTTLTVSPNWTTPPAFGTLYRVLRVPNATSQYIVRDGPNIGTTFDIKLASNPASGTQFQLFKSACRVGGFDLTMAYNPAKLAINSDAGVSSVAGASAESGAQCLNAINDDSTQDDHVNDGCPASGPAESSSQCFDAVDSDGDTLVNDGCLAQINKVTTFNDHDQNWKQNEWAGSRVTITGGPAFGQTQLVVSNTATQLVVSPGWTTTPPNVIPTSSSVYQLGGITDAGFLSSSGRTTSCPGGSIYGSGTAQLHCVSYGTGGGNGLPQAATGTGNLLYVTFETVARGVSNITLTSQILEVDSSTIPADVVNGSRRVILCPDSAPPASPDGTINAGDQLQMAFAFGQNSSGPLYTPQKDPDESGVINAGDQLALAGVFLKKCVQPVVGP